MHPFAQLMIARLVLISVLALNVLLWLSLLQSSSSSWLMLCISAASVALALAGHRRCVRRARLRDAADELVGDEHLQQLRQLLASAETRQTSRRVHLLVVGKERRPD